MYLEIVKQLTEQFKALNEQDFAGTPAFKVMLRIRDQLIKLGFDEDLANRAVASIDVTIPVEFDDESMKAVIDLADEMARLAANVRAAVFRTFGESDDLFIKMLDGAEIKFT